MSQKLLAVLGVTAGALVAAAALAPAASASHSPLAPSHRSAVAPTHVSPMKRGNCYSNLKGDTGIGIVSQNFESSFDQYDTAAADNFSTVKTCKAAGVYAQGVYFNGSGPAASETVTFYSDDNGAPGSVIASQTVSGADNGGSFTIPLDTVALPPGPKWVSVVANMDFSSGGEWGWETTSNQKGGSDGVWQNPGNGFATGCTTWGDVLTCVPSGEGPDFMVAVTK